MSSFFDWLAGFIDGEGSFNASVHTDPQGSTHRAATLIIKVRADDRPILEQIKRETGVGVVAAERSSYALSKPMARWRVGRPADCLRMVEILDAHPLRAKKARDYAVWRELVLEWRSIQLQPVGQRDFERFDILAVEIRRVRRWGEGEPALPPPRISSQLDFESVRLAQQAGVA